MRVKPLTCIQAATSLEVFSPTDNILEA